MSVGFFMTLSLLLDGTGTLVDILAAFQLDQLVRDFAPAALYIVQLTVGGALLIGLINLIGVHLIKTVRVRQYRLNSLWSLLLVVSSLTVIFVAVLEAQGNLAPADGQPTYSAVLRNTVQFSVEASLAGLLAFSLVYGAFRFSRKQVSIESMIFLVVMVLNLLLLAGLALPRWFTQAQQSVVDAGANGILLGAALATLVAGVRVLIGQDRSYRE